MTRRLPAEWEVQAAILLAWPHSDSDWAPLLEKAEATYLEIIRAITRFEPALLIVADIEDVTAKLQAAKIDLKQVQLYQIPTNDTWVRDFGPITVINKNTPHLLDFTFTGWGGKFPADFDNAVTNELIKRKVFSATSSETLERVLEGGSIESDGMGALLTTSACLLNPNRNSQPDRGEIEAELEQHFGVSYIHWLEHGYLAGDDTDSHIDTLARFAPAQTIIYQACDDPDDEHFHALKTMEQELQSLRTLADKPYRLLSLPWPQAHYDEDGERLPATYANFLVINGAVLVPTYADQADDKALKIIGEAFPGREVIGIDCRTLIRQHGSLHCVTMQLPRGVLR